jgi:hypothetical protein
MRTSTSGDNDNERPTLKTAFVGRGVDSFIWMVRRSTLIEPNISEPIVSVYSFSNT